ncbi:MAG: SCO family protein [Deltaproteobacteria bacterium]|nr:SCO family protein [Deltaproteobacteria bacterium]
MARATAAVTLAVLLVGAALALVAMREVAWKPAELPVLGQVPAFSLIDQEGAKFTDQRLKGRVWAASFFYTSCPGPCPVLVEKLAELRRRVSPEHLAVVSFSVDPDTDTAEVLRAYAREHGITTSQSWWLATGLREEVLALIRNGFLSAVSREEPAEGAATSQNGPIMHSTRVLLIDGDRRIRGVYSSDESEALSRLEDDATHLRSHRSSKRD